MSAKDRIVSVRLSEDEYEFLRDRAEKRGWSVSEVLRIWLRIQRPNLIATAGPGITTTLINPSNVIFHTPGHLSWDGHTWTGGPA